MRSDGGWSSAAAEAHPHPPAPNTFNHASQPILAHSPPLPLPPPPPPPPPPPRRSRLSRVGDGSLSLCLVGFLVNFKPSEPFLTSYLLDVKRLTPSQVSSTFCL